MTRLADGRYDVRFKLWDVVKGSELGGQSNAVEAGRPAPGRAPHRRLHLREADRREGRVLDPHRLRHAGPAAATRCASPMPTARTARSRSTAAEPIISPAWSPNGKELAYVSFERQKAVVYVAQRRQRRAPRDRQLPRLEQRAGLVARRRAAGGDAVARRRLAALPRSARNGGDPRRLDDEPGDRHRAGVLAPTAAASTSPATAAAAPQIYRMAAGGGARRARHLQRQLQHQPDGQPGRPHARLRHPRRQRLPPGRPRPSTPGAQPQAITDTSDDEQPELRAERAADHLRDARARPRAC